MSDPSAEAALPFAARTIPALAFEAAGRFGDAIFLEDGPAALSFSGFADEVVRAARAFLAAGVAPGDRVALWAPNVWEWVVAAVGVQAAGGVLVPLSTRLKGREAGFVLRKSGARLLVTMGGTFLGTDYVAALRDEELPRLERIVTLRGNAAGAQAWEDFLAAGAAVSEDAARARAAAVGPDDLSDLLFTSGTTGQPKGVMTAHEQNLRAFAVWSDVVGLREGDRYLIVNAFFHSFGYKAGWLACLMRGATALPHAVFDASAVLARLGRERISVLPGPPTLYQSLLAHPDLAVADRSSLRLAVTGAAPVPVELIRRMREELGFETVITAYGLTECCGMVSICRPEDDAETISRSSGRAIPGIEVRCVDGDGKEVPRGAPGEVVVRGYNVMRGYFEEPEETAKTIDADGWLHTGDVAVMDECGYLRITDRIKDMFIVGGFNCYPAEIESLLYGSGWFAAVAVAGVPDERMGEVGRAWVVPAPGRSFTPEEVIAWCRANMANYKVPRRVEIVSELPVNASGKVMKFVLRERAGAA
ncbi:MAG TPA: FadD3 family acyl-CoA ligase [Myxococcota bacterium]|nr:FadD3 family acyl-CoA ligase [Myxococcota bacterium]